MLNWIKNLFVGTPAPASTVDAKVEAVNAAPYKVPEPTATTPIPLVVEKIAPAVVEVSAAKFEDELKSPSELVVETLIAAKATKTKKAPAKPKTAAVKKAVTTTASKKPTTRGRKPKTGV